MTHPIIVGLFNTTISRKTVSDFFIIFYAMVIFYIRPGNIVLYPLKGFITIVRSFFVGC